MSEYQYYEFLALDRPLTAKQRAELRSISTRAEITATRFVNEYEWGDLKGDPRTMMERYFDAFLYLANWGTRRLMFRLSSAVLDAATAARYCDTNTASLIETGSHQSDEVDDEDTEPPVPAGLGNLSASLQAVADFLEIDEDLIAVAAASSPPIREPSGFAEWVASRPAEEKDALLARVAAGEGAQVQALLLRRLRAASGSPPTAPARTAAELRQAAGDHKAARAEAAEQRRLEAEARRAPAQAAVYAKHLDQLATRAEAAWAKAAELIETKRPRDYDLAVSLLRDLQALPERQEDPAAFRMRFAELRAQHQRQPSLLDRFDQAGLPS
jgi:hypothetical protein